MKESETTAAAASRRDVNGGDLQALNIAIKNVDHAQLEAVRAARDASIRAIQSHRVHVAALRESTAQLRTHAEAIARQQREISRQVEMLEEARKRAESAVGNYRDQYFRELEALAPGEKLREAIEEARRQVDTQNELLRAWRNATQTLTAQSSSRKRRGRNP